MEGKRQEWREGKKTRQGLGVGPSDKVLNSCFAGSEFPSISYGEREFKGGTGKSRERGQDSSNSPGLYILWPEAHLPLQTEGAGKVAGKGRRVAGSSDEDQIQQGEGSSESHLDSHIPSPIIRVPITCTACRRCLRTKVDAF